MTATLAGSEGALGSGFCRLQVAGPTTRVDLALPTAVPLAGLLPAIVTFAEQDAAAPHGWALSRLDGPLDLAASLAVAGIREGELLLLHPAHDAAGEPLYDDVVEVLGSDVGDPTGSSWSARDTRRSAGLLGALAVLGAVGAAVRVGTPLAGVVLAVLTLLLLGGGAAVAHAADDVPTGTLMATLASLSGAAFVVVLIGRPFGTAHLVLAAGVVVLAAATGPALVEGGDAVFLGVGVTALHALLGGLLALATGASPAQAAAVVGPLALALTTVLPTLALRLSRIPRPPLPRTAADLAEVPGQLELDVVMERVRRARALLSGLLVGSVVAATLAIVVLATAGTGWSAGLAAVLGTVLLLRARLFRRRAQVAAPLVGVGVLVVAGTAAAVARWGAGGTVVLAAVVPIALLVALLAGAVGVRDGHRPLSPRLSRGLDLLETMLLLAVVPVALAVWDVYALLLEIAA